MIAQLSQELTQTGGVEGQISMRGTMATQAEVGQNITKGTTSKWTKLLGRASHVCWWFPS